MTHKHRTIIETAAFFSFACIISSVTMLSFAGIDPFAPNNALNTTTAKVAR